MRINPVIFTLTLAACAFSACSTRPAYVLSDKEMEDVLYDLYLAEVAIGEYHYIFNNDSAAKQDLLNSVFMKHKITAQVFDTSLFWYNQDMERYLKINEKVVERFSALSGNLKNQIEQIEAEKRRAELWNLYSNATSFFLQAPGFFQNRFDFEIDSVQWQLGCSYNLAFNVLGISDSIHPVLSFCLQTADTVFVNRDTIRVSGFYSKTFPVPGNRKVDKICGTFIIPDDEKVLLLFHDITLLKQEKDVLINPEDRKIALQKNRLQQSFQKD